MNNMARMLVVDDQAYRIGDLNATKKQIKFLENYLGKNYKDVELRMVVTNADAIEALKTGEWNVVVYDSSMDMSRGGEIYRKIRELQPNSKLVLVSVEEDFLGEELPPEASMAMLRQDFYLGELNLEDLLNQTTKPERAQQGERRGSSEPSR
jgi:CheY-like chemotaxis protein